MSGGNYQRSVFRQLEETIQRLDRMEKQHEEDTRRLGQEHRREMEAVKATLNGKIDGLQAKITSRQSGSSTWSRKTNCSGMTTTA